MDSQFRTKLSTIFECQRKRRYLTTPWKITVFVDVYHIESLMSLDFFTGCIGGKYMNLF